jgi:hypothetical protein
VAREPGLQESAEETTRNTVADHRDPDLVSTADHTAPPVPSFTATAEQKAEGAAQEEVGVIPEVLHGPEASTGVEAATPSTQLSEADFEARVAAAMAAYGNATESRQATSPDNTAQGQVTEIARMEAEAAAEPGDGIPVYKYEPTVVNGAEEKEHAGLSVAIPVEVEERATASEQQGMGAAPSAVVDPEAVQASVEAELPAAVHAVADATEATEQDHDNIAQAVHRVMERMKANLVEEIVRELKLKK